MYLRPSREDNLGKNRLHDLLSVFRDATTNFLDGEVGDNASPLCECKFNMHLGRIARHDAL